MCWYHIIILIKTFLQLVYSALYDVIMVIPVCSRIKITKQPCFEVSLQEVIDPSWQIHVLVDVLRLGGFVLEMQANTYRFPRQNMSKLVVKSQLNLLTVIVLITLDGNKLVDFDCNSLQMIFIIWPYDSQLARVHPWKSTQELDSILSSGGSRWPSYFVHTW